ncbi:hypothetical protein Ae150APs1_6153c [Pseudonocardia sp. Ae150A_Ps1]|nr:hypothetical protein Ae150APs1_6151 [Pseudonocardia sp. Ae150A_Ps1]OLL70065.1 hypothetical protein Ae150APs1_6153c [Pseudonocardia sp. Ae150A_Ps1]
MRLDVGDVGDPQPVRGRRGEVALDQVRAQVGAVGTDGGPRHPLPPDTAQACGFHEPADGAPRDRPVVCLAPGLMEGVKPGDDEQRWQPHGSTPTSCGNERSGWSSTPRPTLSTPARTSAAVSVTSWESFRKPCAAG